MAQPKKQSRNCHDQALEMRMRDVLDGLENMACYISYKAVDTSFEILSIEQPPEQDPLLEGRRASVHALADKQKQLALQKNNTPSPGTQKRMPKRLYVDMADYLIARESQRS